MSSRGSNSSTYNYTMCLDSVNRDMQQNPESNPVTLNVDLSKLRRGIVQIDVGSVELPAPQYTIEEAWQNVCFDDGVRIETIPLAVGVPPLNVSGGQTFLITDSAGAEYMPILPLYDNPVTDVTPGAGFITVTTRYPHGLALRELWDPVNPVVARFPIVWEGTGLTGATNPEVVILTGNPGLTIVDDYTFTLVTAVAFTGGAPLGSLNAPAVDSPVAFATLLNAALQVAGYTEGTFEYDTWNSRFLFRTTFSGSVAPTSICLQAVGTGLPTNLLACMGFISCCTATRVCAINQLPGINTWGILADSGPQWRGSIAASVGNYVGDMAALGSDMTLQWNRLYFDSQAGTPTPPTNEVLVFSNASNTIFMVPVPWGAYTPETFAAFLQASMNAVATPQTFTVTFQPVTNTSECPGCGSLRGVFVFASPLPFGLEFSDSSTSSSVPVRMGFSNVPQRNGTSYEGKVVVFPRVGCASPHYPHLLVNTLALNAKRHYRYEPTLPRVVALNVTGPVGNVYTFGPLAPGPPVVAPSVAHGFQVGDVVYVTQGGATYLARVLSVIDAFTFSAALGQGGGTPAPPLVGGTAYGTLYQDSTTLNIYMNAPQRSGSTSRNAVCSIKPPILGFSFTDLMAPAPFESIKPVMLEPPPYLLLQVVDTKGSSYIQHDYLGDTVTNLLAKIVFFPVYQFQRIFPVSLTYNGSEILTRIQFRWLTPEHDIYQMHGRDWSMTLTMYAIGEVPMLMCS